ncbi:MAG: chemotaxis protein CheW [Desulfovibrionaceae bacterium]|nr:chemotaxis protein CheW [Desulfovibrionaceae bacterium]MBF0512575.1 chemotaxis protein CheW [Desulfovibrionaceae bacterium]
MNETNSAELNQYLTFTLAGELFALDIAAVREVLDNAVITRIPRTVEFLRGIINLRGNAVTVVDLRMKFGLGRTEMTENTCIVIVEVVIDGESIVLGAMADSVHEVYDLDPAGIEAAPSMGTVIEPVYIKGMAKHENSFIVIIDTEKLFSLEELRAVPGMGRAA